MNESIVLAVIVISLSVSLAACGKKSDTTELQQSMNDISRGPGYNPTAKDVVQPNIKAKALIAADQGKKVAYQCKLGQKFINKRTADERPSSIPDISIKYIGDFKMELMASSPDKATEILDATDELGLYRVLQCLPASGGVALLNAPALTPNELLKGRYQLAALHYGPQSSTVA